MIRTSLIEMWRTKGRYGAVVAALSLIVLLVLVLAALTDGLFAGSTDALANSEAQIQVFDDASRESLVRSSLGPDVAEEVAAVTAVTEVGELSVLLGGADGPHGDLDVALLGFQPDAPGEPTHLVEGTLPAEGESGVAAVDRTLAEDEVAIGDTVTFAGSGIELEVVGVVDRTEFQLQPTVWVPTAQLQEIRGEVRPEATGQDDAVGAFPVRTDEDPAQVAAAITEQVDGVSAVTTEEAILAIPGVAEQDSVLRAVIAATYGVAALVITLFFALITLEKRNLLAMLKALGGSTRSLGAGLIVQALVAAAAALAIGGALTAVIIASVGGFVPVRLEPQTVATVVPATFATAAVGAALSFRRVSRVDPASALGGTL